MSSIETVPRGVNIAAAWAWRLIVIGIVTLALLSLIHKFLIITLPIFVALLLASAARPIANKLATRIPRRFASLAVFLGTVASLGLLVYFVIQQVIANSGELTDSAYQGVSKIEAWLIDGPLHIRESQLTDALDSAQAYASSQAANMASTLAGFGGVVGNIIAGLLIALFAFYFFLSEGERIWAWCVRLFPKAAQDSANSSGVVAWDALQKYTSATILVAFIDALGIMFIAWLLGVPLVLAIGVLVFLGAFIPMVGGLLTGLIAVLLALVAQGPTEALLMLGGVVTVQQIEGNFLQPLIMGKFVSVHPLGVLLSITAGFTLAGIPGALVAVPFVACVNAVVLHLTGNLVVGDAHNESQTLPTDELNDSLNEESLDKIALSDSNVITEDIESEKQ